VILSLQTARFLIKCAHDVQQNGVSSVPESVRYLGDAPLTPGDDTLVSTPDGIVSLFRYLKRVLKKGPLYYVSPV
jgi:hypothetical protein